MACGNQNPIFVGPWGGTGGEHFDDGNYTGVRRIDVTHGECLDSIQIQYDKDGKPVWSTKHGGQGGILSGVNLDFPSEYLTGITGHIGHYNKLSRYSDPVIRSVKFRTNKTTYGPFGEPEGTPFSLPIKGGKIVGFGGKSDKYLDSIGFHIRQT